MPYQESQDHGAAIRTLTEAQREEYIGRQFSKLKAKIRESAERFAGELRVFVLDPGSFDVSEPRRKEHLTSPAYRKGFEELVSMGRDPYIRAFDAFRTYDGMTHIFGPDGKPTVDCGYGVYVRVTDRDLEGRAVPLIPLETSARRERIEESPLSSFGEALARLARLFRKA